MLCVGGPKYHKILWLRAALRTFVDTLLEARRALRDQVRGGPPEMWFDYLYRSYAARQGEELGDGLTVSWSTMYDEFARLQTDRELSKGDYLAVVNSLLPDLQQAHTALSAGVQAVRAHTLVETDFIDSVAADLRRIEAANDQIATGGAEPYECGDVDLKLMGFVNHMHNVVLYFRSEIFLAREPSNRLWLAADSPAGRASISRILSTS